MVNQVDLKAVVEQYSLCEERGSLGTVLRPCRSIYTHHMHNNAQHTTEDHYDAVDNNSLARTRMVCCRMLYLFVFGKLGICLYDVRISGIPYQILVKITEQKRMT